MSCWYLRIFLKRKKSGCMLRDFRLMLPLLRILCYIEINLLPLCRLPFRGGETRSSTFICSQEKNERRREAVEDRNFKALQDTFVKWITLVGLL